MVLFWSFGDLTLKLAVSLVRRGTISLLFRLDTGFKGGSSEIRIIPCFLNSPLVDARRYYK